MGGSNIGGGRNPWTHLYNTENKGYLGEARLRVTLWRSGPSSRVPTH
jgi:hypothetical protein